MKYREEYLGCGGTFCPYCKSANIHNEAEVYFGNGITVVASCNDCHED